jgi:hypothetical protein
MAAVPFCKLCSSPTLQKAGKQLAIKIGSVAIELTSDTVKFQEGMAKAQAIALSSTRNIERSFTAMGAAIAAATGSAIGALGLLIERTEEAVVSMNRMAQQSGTSIEAFSKLAYAAKLAGMPIEDMSTILTRISHSAFEAASGNKEAAAAYKLLGVSVTNANGSFKTADEIAQQLAKSLDGYKDSAAKTGIETMLMGRSGARAAEFLNILANRFDEVSEKASRLGVVFDKETTAQAQKLHDSFIDLEEAGFGLSTRLLSQVSPALDSVVDKIVAFVSNADNMRKLDEIGQDIAKGVTLASDSIGFLIDHAQTVKTIFEGLLLLRFGGWLAPMIGSASEATNFLGKLGVASGNLAGRLLGIGRAGTYLPQVLGNIASQAKYNAQFFALMAQEEGVAAAATWGLSTATEGLAAALGSIGAVVLPIAGVIAAFYDLSVFIHDTHELSAQLKKDGLDWTDVWQSGIHETVGSLEGLKQTITDIATGNYGDIAMRVGIDASSKMPGKMAGGRNFSNAPGVPQGYDWGKDGGKKNLGALPQDEKVDRLAQKLAELVEKANAAQRALALVGASPQAQRDSEILERYNTFLADQKVQLDKLTPVKRAAAEATAHAAIANEINYAWLTKYRTALLEITQATASTAAEHLAMADAVGRSAKAMQAAAIQARVNQDMQRIGGAGWRNDPKMVADAAQLAAGYADEANKANLEADSKTLASQSQQLAGQRRMNDAILAGAEAKRQAEIANQQSAIRQDFADRGDTDSQALQRQIDMVRQKSDAEKQAADLERANGLSIAQRYRDEVQAIRDAVQAAKDHGEAIDYREVLEADKEAWIQFTDAQNKALLATGSMLDGLRAAMNEIANDAESDAQRIRDAVSQAVGSLNDQLAKLMTGQKANFGTAFRGIAENLAKQSLQKGESAVLGKLGFGNKPDGSQNKPFWVKMAGGKGGSAGLGSLFGGSAGGDGDSDAGSSSASSNVSNGVMSAISGLAKIFLPGFADGTDSMIPGMPSIVGEKGPEIFVPPAAGAIVPNSRLKNGLGQSHTFNIDARGSNDPAQTVALINQALKQAAPVIAGHAVRAVNENNRRRPTSGR